MAARKLIPTAFAVVALAVPAAQACNITADVDHAVRMTQTQPARGVLSAVKQSSQWLTQKRLQTDGGANRMREPWPGPAPVGSSSLRDYPR